MKLSKIVSRWAFDTDDTMNNTRKATMKRARVSLFGVQNETETKTTERLEVR